MDRLESIIEIGINKNRTAHQILKLPIINTDRILKDKTTDGLGEPGSRFSSCGYSSAIFDYLYRMQNKELQLNLPAPIQTNIWAIYALVDFPDHPEEVTSIFHRYQKAVEISDTISPDYNQYISYVHIAPEHQVVIVSIANQAYLIDLTFCQFIDNNGCIDFNGGEPLYKAADSPEISSILQNYFLCLDENTLRQFLIHTTSSSQLQEKYRTLDFNTLSKMLQQFPVLESDHSDEELSQINTNL